MKLWALINLAAALVSISGSARAVTQSQIAGPPSALASETPEELKHRLMGELEATLTEDAGSVRMRQHFPIWTGANYWTRARLSGVRGLCFANFVEFEFASPNDPSTISALGVLSYYYLLSPPSALQPKPADADDAVGVSACAGLHPGAQDRFIESSDEDTASTGAWIFNAALAQVRAGRPSLPIVCDSRDETACRKQFAELAPSQLKSINKCDLPRAAHANCWEFEVDKPGQTTPRGDCSTANVMCVIVPAGYDSVRIMVDDHSAPTKVTESAVGFTE